MVNFFGKNYSTYFASLVRVALKIGNYFHLIDRKINLPPTFCCFQIQGGLICSNVTHQNKNKNAVILILNQFIICIRLYGARIHQQQQFKFLTPKRSLKILKANLRIW